MQGEAFFTFKIISLTHIKDCFFKLLNFHFLLKISKFSKIVNNESLKKKPTTKKKKKNKHNW